MLTKIFLENLKDSTFLFSFVICLSICAKLILLKKDKMLYLQCNTYYTYIQCMSASLIFYFYNKQSSHFVAITSGTTQECTCLQEIKRYSC